MNTSREEKQVEKISKLQQELEKTRKRVKSLECKLSTSERKRKALAGDKKKDHGRHTLATC
jgi:hypothetical protein